jgi:hypothetical protein
MIKVRGIIIPVDWDDEGVAIAFSLSTYDEAEYLLESGLAREDLLARTQEAVAVSGRLKIENGRKVLLVAEIHPDPEAVAPFGDFV